MPHRLLTDIDEGEVLSRLQLTSGQACQLVGITRVQLDYWLERARLDTGPGPERRFDWPALRMLLLVKQGRDLGLGVDTAIAAARRRLELIAESAGADLR